MNYLLPIRTSEVYTSSFTLQIKILMLAWLYFYTNGFDWLKSFPRPDVLEKGKDGVQIIDHPILLKKSSNISVQICFLSLIMSLLSL